MNLRGVADLVIARPRRGGNPRECAIEHRQIHGHAKEPEDLRQCVLRLTNEILIPHAVTELGMRCFPRERAVNVP
jgi:hypothetical protein